MIRKIPITIALVALATGLQWILWPIFTPNLFLLYYPTVLLATRYGSGMLAIFLSMLCSEFFFAAPLFSLQMNSDDMARQFRFFISALMIRQIMVSLTKTLKISEQNRMQLQESEMRLQNVLNHALDAVVGMDLNGCVSQWNTQAEFIFKFNREEALGKKMSEMIIPLQHRQAHEHGMKHYLATGHARVLNTRIEITALRKNGEEFPIELSITPIHSEGKPVHFYAFIRDISDRKQKEDERNALLAKLEGSLRVRDEFTSIASHELKTPITALKMQFQMAERQMAKGDPHVFLPEVTAKRITSANRLLERMMKLIEDMLDVSRISAGKFNLEMEKVDLSLMIQETVDQFSHQLKSVHSKLHSDLPQSVFILGDRYRLEQVLFNLFTNAIKYAPGKNITITLTSDQKSAYLVFQDEGQGIAPENLERIFHRFERAISANNISGLGLGLYISRQIIEEHGGKIWAESTPGKNSRFLIELPIASI